jgi:hypothetical protein
MRDSRFCHGGYLWAAFSWLSSSTISLRVNAAVSCEQREWFLAWSSRPAARDGLNLQGTLQAGGSHAWVLLTYPAILGCAAAPDRASYKYKRRGIRSRKHGNGRKALVDRRISS